MISVCQLDDRFVFDLMTVKPVDLNLDELDN